MNIRYDNCRCESATRKFHSILKLPLYSLPTCTSKWRVVGNTLNRRLFNTVTRFCDCAASMGVDSTHYTFAVFLQIVGIGTFARADIHVLRHFRCLFCGHCDNCDRESVPEVSYLYDICGDGYMCETECWGQFVPLSGVCEL